MKANWLWVLGAFAIWSLGLGWVVMQTPSMLWAYVYLTMYVTTVLYAMNMRAQGALNSTAAILLAVFVTPLAAFLFFFRWADLQSHVLRS